MKFLKLKFFTFVLLVLNLHPLHSNESIEPFTLLTIPKSGSHLTIKALHFMTGGVPIWHTKFPSAFYISPKKGFLYTHLCISPGLEDDYAHLPKLKKIINVRDLRDVAISMVHQILANFWPGMSYEEREAFKKASFDEQLLWVINYDYEVQDKEPGTLQVSLTKIGEQIRRYCQDPRNLICKYENLAGKEAGGSEELQIEELYRIANYLKIPTSDIDLAQIASQLYGNENNPFQKGTFKKFKSTFRKGSIGAWETLFTEEHKAAFKEKHQKTLEILGYEQDANW